MFLAFFSAVASNQIFPPMQKYFFFIYCKRINWTLSKRIVLFK